MASKVILESRRCLLQFRKGINLGFAIDGDHERQVPIERKIAIRIEGVVALVTGLERKYQSLRMLRFPASPSRHVHGQKAERCSRQGTCDGAYSELRPQTLCFVVEEQEVLLVQKPGNTKCATTGIGPRIVN